MEVSEQLAKFVAETNFEDIPSWVIETQKKSILDSIAITLGAATLGDGCRSFVELARENAGGGAGEATVIGFGEKLPVSWAAFANGAMAHSLDFGDTQMDAVVHSNASTFPAALAMAEKLGNIDGRQLLTALVLGSEVACRISLGANEDLEKFGYYMPTIYTSFGATAAVCKLLGLSAEQIRNAFSFNLCQSTCSSELMNNSQTVMRSIRESFSARNAVLSAQIAQKGLKGFDEPLAGKLGFYHAYARNNCDLERVGKGLGENYYAGTLYFKLWPSCAGTHPAIIAVRELMKEHQIKPEEVTHVHVITSVRNRMLMEPEGVKKAPSTSIMGKFSIPYTASAAMLRGDVTLDDFTPAAFKDREVLSLAAKFTYEVNDAWGKKEGMNTNVTINTARGSWHYFYRESPLPAPGTDKENGQGGNGAGYEELSAKLASCAKHAIHQLSPAQLEEIEAIVKSFESLDNINEFTKLL